MKNVKIAKVQGFTLIELMIGLALGLMATLAIFATVSSFESQRRTTASGVDMQQNGLLALYSMEQDIRMAGYGLIGPKSLSLPCGKINAYGIPSVFSAAPVMISNGSTGNDILAINRLNSDTGGIVTGSETATLTAPFAATGSMGLNTNLAINANDFLLVSQPGLDCTLLKVSTVPASLTGGVVVQSAGNAGADTTQTPAAFPNYAMAASAVVVNLGPNNSSVPANSTIFGSTTDATINPRFSTIKYRIQANANNSAYDLQRTTDNWTSSSIVASNIVNVSAQYGISDASNAAVSPTPQNITHWIDATGNSYGGSNWATLSSVADIKRIKAIRVAIVARSADKVNKRDASGNCTTTTTSPIWFDNPAIDLSGMTDWQCYRYKVYQTVIPIRNVIWGNFQ
jgi:type IV pilus assembly protein PilW